MDIQTVKDSGDGGYLVNGALSVPNDPANRHYQAVQDWIGEGNIPAPADPEPAFEPSEIDIRLRALETAAGVTDTDRDTARTQLMTEGGR